MPTAEKIVATLQYTKIATWGFASFFSAVGGVLGQVETEVRRLNNLAPPEPDPAVRSAAEVVAEHMRQAGSQTISDYGPNIDDIE